VGRPGAVQGAVRLLPAAQHPTRNALSADAGDDRRPRRPRRARAQLQVHRHPPGCAGRTGPGADPDRDARRPLRREAHPEEDRGRHGHARLHRVGAEDVAAALNFAPRGRTMTSVATDDRSVEALRGRATGVLFLSGFGALWFLLGLAASQRLSLPTACALAAGLAALVAGAVLLRRRSAALP